MYSTRLLQLLLVALSIVCVAQASWIDIDKIHKNERRIVRRASPSQASDVEPSSAAPVEQPSATEEDPVTTEGGTDQQTSEVVDTAKPSEETNKPSQPSATEPETTAAEETTAAAPTEDPASTKAASKPTTKDSQPAETAASTQADDSEPTTAASATDDNAPQSTQDAPATTSAASSGSNQNDDSSSSGGDDQASQTEAEENTKVTAKPVTSTHIDVVTRTDSDGNLETMTSTSVTTSTPGLNSEDDDGSSSGMSPKTRNTVIGVVVGIGGAIVVGALGLVAWRIWGRKKHNDEADGLMDYNENNNGSLSGLGGSYNGVEKTEPGSAGGSAGGPQRSPFQSTLDNYHQPTPVNASSNF